MSLNWSASLDMNIKLNKKLLDGMMKQAYLINKILTLVHFNPGSIA